MTAHHWQSPVLWLGLVCAAVFNSPATTHAFSDPAAFAAPVLEAGGGGRFYTGSRAEGYGCDSCHTGREPPELQIEGLPARYVPRATYEVRVVWSRKLEHVSATLELTDERGHGAGTLALPPAGEYVDAELCQPTDVGALAAQLYPADRDRTVAATPDCGASTLRVQWIAPSKDVGPVWLAGSLLTSDHAGDFVGDGARNFTRVIPGFGEPLPDIVTEGGCSVASRAFASRAFPAPPAIAWSWLAAIFALAWRRKRAKRSGSARIAQRHTG